jgi:hypothetical protein
MNREKVLVNFRTFKAYRNALDLIAKKRGKSVTQFLNELIYSEIRKDVTDSAAQSAVLYAAERNGLPDYDSLLWGDQWFDLLEELQSVGKEEKWRQITRDWRGKFVSNLKDYFKNIGLEDPNYEVASIVSEFAKES